MGTILTAKDLNLDDDQEDLETSDDVTVTSPDKKDSPETEPKLEVSPKEQTIGVQDKEEIEDEKPIPETYKTQEEAEKAVKEAKRSLHEATTERAKLRKVVADLELRLNEASKAAPPAPPGVSPFEKDRQQIADDTMAEVSKLPYPPVPKAEDFDTQNNFEKATSDFNKAVGEYNNKVARIWVVAQSRIAKVALDEQRQMEEDQNKVVSFVNKTLKDHGVDDVDGIIDLFWSQSSYAPKNLSMEDQIKDTAKRCKEIVEKIRGKERERGRRDKDEKGDLDVLGHGAKIKTKTGDEAPKTMKEAQEASRNRRRLGVTP